MDWPDDPYILISDGDMWPMSAEIFNEQTSVEASVHLIWPKEYVPGKSVVPSCYIGMNVSTWREVMHIKKGDDMMQTVAALRNLVSKGSLSKSQQWSIDQNAFTKRLYDWKGFPDKVHFFGRDRARDRLDRGGGGGNLYGVPVYWIHMFFALASFLKTGHGSDSWQLIFSMKSK